METVVLVAVLAFVLLILSISDDAGRSHPGHGRSPTHRRTGRNL